MFDLTDSKRRLRDISQKVWKRKSGDPTHIDNASDADWQAGYLLGCFTEEKESSSDITKEWCRRGKPTGVEKTDDCVPERQRTQSWRSWKAGYWAGRFTHL